MVIDKDPEFIGTVRNPQFEENLVKFLKKILPFVNFSQDKRKPLDDIYFEKLIKNSKKNTNKDQPYIDCKYDHNFSCELEAFIKSTESVTRIYKIYLLVHLVPYLLFKRKKIKNEPISSFLDLCHRVFRSTFSIFMMVFFHKVIRCRLTKFFKKFTSKTIYNKY